MTEAPRKSLDGVRWLVLIVACHREPCPIDLAGNLVERASGCPTLAAGAGATAGHAMWKLHIPRGEVAIDLGPTPTPGTYRAGTTALWSATSTRTVGAGACIYRAGNTATPTGDFALELTSIDPLHGALTMTLPVLPRVSDDGRATDCGAGTTEQLRARF